MNTPLHKAEKSGPSAPAIGLMHAVSDKNMEALRQHISAGSDVNLLSGTLDRTPLMEAALQDWSEGITALIAAGAQVNAVNKAGETAALMAVVGKKVAALRALAAGGADLSVTDSTDESLLGLTSRRWVAQEITQALIDCGAPLNMQGADGKTPLMRSMDEPDSNHVASRYLIMAGADTEVRDGDGNTPLIRAVQKGATDIVEWLLEKDAIIDAVNDRGETARQLAEVDVGKPGLPGFYAEKIIGLLDAAEEKRLQQQAAAKVAARARSDERHRVLRNKAPRMGFRP